jgi:hypothetical protein
MNEENKNKMTSEENQIEETLDGRALEEEELSEVTGGFFWQSWNTGGRKSSVFGTISHEASNLVQQNFRQNVLKLPRGK